MMSDCTEMLCGDDVREYYVKICRAESCYNTVTHDDEVHCYPHSRWYRPFLVPWNMFVDFIEDLPAAAVAAAGRYF